MGTHEGRTGKGLHFKTKAAVFALKTERVHVLKMYEKWGNSSAEVQEVFRREEIIDTNRNITL